MHLFRVTDAADAAAAAAAAAAVKTVCTGELHSECLRTGISRSLWCSTTFDYFEVISLRCTAGSSTTSTAAAAAAAMVFYYL